MKRKSEPSILQLPIHCGDVLFLNRTQGLGFANTYAERRVLRSFQQHFTWQVDLDAVLANAYEALVLTDNNQVIQWVNEGFTAMTGYPKQLAVGKRPNFLQGKRTTEVSKRSIRTQLGTGKVFSEIVVNYRANGEEYLCRVEIYPLPNENQEITHYLALEREVA